MKLNIVKLMIFSILIYFINTSLNLYASNEVPFDVKINGSIYCPDKKLGSGSFGDVYSVLNSDKYVLKFSNEECDDLEEDYILTKILKKLKVNTPKCKLDKSKKVALKTRVHGVTLKVLCEKNSSHLIDSTMKEDLAVLFLKMAKGLKKYPLLQVGDIHEENLMFDLNLKSWFIVDGEINVDGFKGYGYETILDKIRYYLRIALFVCPKFPTLNDDVLGIITKKLGPLK